MLNSRFAHTSQGQSPGSRPAGKVGLHGPSIRERRKVRREDLQLAVAYRVDTTIRMNRLACVLVSCLAATCLPFPGFGAAVPPGTALNSSLDTNVNVHILKSGGGYQLIRNGQDYFIKGAVIGPGGSMETLAAAGANSIRTQPRLLDEAQRHGFTALVGLPLGNPRQGFSYADRNQVQRQFDRVREIVRQYRRHPALLMWNLGNEPEIRTTAAERVPLWKEVNRLAEMVKQEDPDHPVMAVVGGQYAEMLHELNESCPALDLVGLNSYAQMRRLPEEIAREGWTRPYVVTEFGPRGHWQVAKTSWGVPIEDDANAKADFYLKAYQHSVSGQASCLGSYVFYWAHKQEKTHTWYGMFLPDGSRTPAIDAMTFLWTGHWPTNRCPSLEGKRLSIAMADGSNPVNPGVFLPGAKVACAVQVSDPDGDPLQVQWELRPDVADHPGVGGDWEPSVEPLPGAILSTSENERRSIVQLPPKPGKYRVFVYARDSRGNATTANLPLLAQYPPVQAWQPDPRQRENLRRSLTLLSSSTPADRKTVRILFYGQSITQQAWWKEVERYLRASYTNANLVIENRAIGGHAAQLLVKTADADLYPFEPDLLVFHVYGSHTEYENIIRRVRERTCADILLQTDHVTKDDTLNEETDPARLSPKQWDAWMNQVFLPTTASKYEACRADIHEVWKGYLQAHHLKAADLLRDGVHLNPHGEWLMAEVLKPYLAPLAPRAGYDPLNQACVRTVPVAAVSNQNTIRLEFDGTRADLIFRPGATEAVDVRIDGKVPSSIPELYGFTRVSAFPGSDWPILLRVGSAAALAPEEWSLRITEASPEGKVCRFELRGSVTGSDGSGVSTNRFISASRRVVIEPEDWNLSYCVKVFNRPVPQNHTATWRAALHGVDKAAAPDALPNTEHCLTVAQGLSPGHHVLELQGAELATQIQSARFYCPPLLNRSRTGQ